MYKIISRYKVCTLVTAACLFFMLIFLPLAVSADTSSTDMLISTANEKRLASSPQWLALLHYVSEGTAWKSSINDSQFFLDPNGQTNAQVELESMIRGMTDIAYSEYGKAVCRFPARATWLGKSLNIQNDNFQCNENQIFLEKIKPQHAVLVFPAPRTRGAGAMFGHTMIRFDSDDKSPLLSYSINYAAYTENAGFTELVWKGLSGGFKGRFSFLPYYKKLKEYKEMEERDIWEYPLNLTQEEVTLMALHALELRDISSDYYFLDENCAQLMLSLIDVGRPSLGLTNQFRNRLTFWVIPSDTIQATWNFGILYPPIYQPSTATKLTFFSSMINTDVLRSSEALMNNNFDGVVDSTSEEFFQAVEIAKLALEYRFSRLEIPQEKFSKNYSSLVKLGVKPLEILVPIPTPPHQGHPAGRVELGLGYGEKLSFLELGFRPAYHSRKDPSEGYPRDAELEFFSLAGRYYQKQNSFRLDRASLFNITSFMPYNRFTTSTSWKMNVGVDKYYLRDGEDHLLCNLKIGFGLSSRSECFGTTYILISGSAIAGKALSKNINLGPGIEAGIAKKISSKWQANSSIKLDYYRIKKRETISSINCELSYKLFRDSAITVSGVIAGQELANFYPEYAIRWQQYF